MTILSNHRTHYNLLCTSNRGYFLCAAGSFLTCNLNCCIVFISGLYTIPHNLGTRTDKLTKALIIYLLMTVSIPNDSTSFGDWPLSKSLPELPGAFGSLGSQELGIWGPALLQKEGHHGEGLYHPDNGLSKLTLEHLKLKHSNTPSAI